MKTGKWGLLGILVACAAILGSVALVVPARRSSPTIASPEGSSPLRIPFPVVTPLSTSR